MKHLKRLIILTLILNSPAVFAEGGSDRAKEYWQRFKAGQETVHGNKNTATTSDESKNKPKGLAEHRC